MILKNQWDLPGFKKYIFQFSQCSKLNYNVLIFLDFKDKIIWKSNLKYSCQN